MFYNCKQFKKIQQFNNDKYNILLKYLMVFENENYYTCKY